MKLQKFTDFVNEKCESFLNAPMSYLISCDHLVQLFFSYAKFLQQKPELWMFVPCDENGETMTMPLTIDYEGNLKGYNEDYSRFKEAKERCLFKGCVMQNNECYDRVMVNKMHLFSIYDNEVVTYKAIENLIDSDIELSQTAIKQIGL